MPFEIPVEFFYVLVIVLCATLFIKASKAVLKVIVAVVGIAFLIVFVIPHFF